MCFWKKTRLIFESFARAISRAQRYFIFLPHRQTHAVRRAKEFGGLEIYKKIKFHKRAAELLSILNKADFLLLRKKKSPCVPKKRSGNFYKFCAVKKPAANGAYAIANPTCTILSNIPRLLRLSASLHFHLCASSLGRLRRMSQNVGGRRPF